MASLGAILIADDDDTFRQATVELLRRKGYECEGAADAATAAELLRSDRFDLLIADIRMPGNARLELVRELQQIAAGTPVILVTAYPSLDSAIDSIQLPVAAYLTKPFGLEELRTHVQAAMERSQGVRGVTRIIHALKATVEDCEQLQARLGELRKDVPQDELGRGLRSIVRELAECLGETRCLLRTCVPGQDTGSLCDLMACGRWRILERALNDAIAVIERTKKAFKSKELGDLRVRLEAAMAAVERVA